MIVAGDTQHDGVQARFASYLRRLYYELAISTSPHAVASALQLAEPDHILFGSDYPALFEEEVRSLTQALAENPLLQPCDLEMIHRHNALQLFPRLRQPSPTPTENCAQGDSTGESNPSPCGH
jgi:predicted TIM-barrel fold metal-dependent hydrolase